MIGTIPSFEMIIARLVDAAGPGQLLDDDRLRHVVGSGAAVGDRDPERGQLHLDAGLEARPRGTTRRGRPRPRAARSAPRTSCGRRLRSSFWVSDSLKTALIHGSVFATRTEEVEERAN